MEKVLVDTWIKTQFEGKQYKFYIKTPRWNKYGFLEPYVYCTVLIEELKTIRILFWNFKYWNRITDGENVKIDQSDYTYLGSDFFKTKCYFNPERAKEIFKRAFLSSVQRSLENDRLNKKIKSINILNKL